MAEILSGYHQTFSFSDAPRYTRRTSEDDRVAIPFVEIRVWQPEKKGGDTDWWTIKDKQYLRLTEISRVEINKSYKNIIQTASFEVPRGSVVWHQGTKENVANGEVKTGTGSNDKLETAPIKATSSGDTLMPGTSQYDSGEGTLSINATRNDDGVIEVETQDTNGLVNANDLAIGQRVNIYMCYAYDEDEYDKLKSPDNNMTGDLVFSGMITKCSVNSPFVVECEDMMSLLKKIPCPNVVAKENYKVNDFLKAGGKFDLLKNTGLKLDSQTEKIDIHVGKIGMTDDLVAADVVDEWSKCGLYTFMNETTDPPSIRVGRVYTSGFNYGKDANVMTADGSVNIIQMDWDAAEDGLTVQRVDKAFIAVEAHGVTADGKFFKFTLRKNPKNNAASNDFQLVNYHKPQSKKGKKKKDASAESRGSMDEATEKVDLDNYTIVPYMSPKVGITKDELRKEAEAYYRKYNGNGVSGSLTLFGDRDIKPTDTVGLIDPRYPERNGYYFVESVEISLTSEGGYRKKIKMPYKIGNFGKTIVIDATQ